MQTSRQNLRSDGQVHDGYVRQDIQVQPYADTGHQQVSNVHNNTQHPPKEPETFRQLTSVLDFQAERGHTPELHALQR